MSRTAVRRKNKASQTAKLLPGLILLCGFTASFASSICADEIRRFVEMSYACGRDSTGQILFAQDSQKHSYEITSWSDPFTENICAKRSDSSQGCTPTQLYDFSFRCGSAGNVRIIDFYVNSREGQKFGAQRENDRISLNGGQQRVLTSHLATDCYGKGLSLPDMNRCLVSADQYRIDQISIKLPPGRSPLPAETQLTTKVIGDDCGNGALCGAGNKCSRGGGCVARNAVDCGNGQSCLQGNKCSVGGGCIPVNAVDCGSGRSCPVGSTCGANNDCVRATAQIAPDARDEHSEQPKIHNDSPPGNPEFSGAPWWRLPAGSASWGVLALILFSAGKELIKAKIDPRNRVFAILGVGIIEAAIYLIFGVNLAEPAVIDVVKINLPILMLTVGVGIYAKVIES